MEYIYEIVKEIGIIQIISRYKYELEYVDSIYNVFYEQRRDLRKCYRTNKKIYESMEEFKKKWEGYEKKYNNLKKKIITQPRLCYSRGFIELSQVVPDKMVRKVLHYKRKVIKSREVGYPLEPQILTWKIIDLLKNRKDYRTFKKLYRHQIHCLKTLQLLEDKVGAYYGTIDGFND